MPNQSRQYITLDSIIKDYLQESEQPIHKYSKLFDIAFRGMDELGIDFFYQIKSVKLPVNANKTVNLPSDFLNYTKVGFLNGKGEVVLLSKNEKLTTYASLFPDRDAKVKDAASFDWNLSVPNNLFFNYFQTGGLGNLYGLPSGAPYVGSFKIDQANGVIVLDLRYEKDYVILEYAASPKEGEEYMIPVVFREALVAYLSWIDIRSMPASRKGTLGDKRDRRSEYYNQRRLALSRWQPFKIEEAYELNLESQRLTVKA